MFDLRSIAVVLAAITGLIWPIHPVSQIHAAGRPVWTEVTWPFPIDEWGTGKAFRCGTVDCGDEIYIYLRSKIGFCNCTSGVSDDSELERLSDFQLIGDKPRALAAGRPVNIAWMEGRSRTYALSGRLRRTSMISVAFNHNCDALVATAVVGQDSVTAELQVMAFLNSDVVTRWAKAELGL